MKRQRLTREQSKDQTRQRLLDAAQAIFMKKGFVAASVEDIAEAAGYTRGAFYSNFRSKPELFLELLRRFRCQPARLLLCGRPSDLRHSQLTLAWREGSWVPFPTENI